MINLQTFRKIKELKEQGVNVSKILEECKISKSQYYKLCIKVRFVIFLVFFNIFMVGGFNLQG